MGLFDSILGAVSGKSGASGEANPLIGSSRRSPRAKRRSARFGQQICTEWPGERISIVGRHG